MEINQISCKACGAPISFQTDADIIKCSYCGTFLGIDRGRENVEINLIQDEPQPDTQPDNQPDESSISPDELIRRQMRREIASALHKLTQIQDEIRRIQQGPASSIASMQLGSLHSDKYSILDRIRLLGQKYSKPDHADIEAFLRYAQQEKSLIQQEIEALQYSDRQDIPQIIQALTERSEDLDEQCLPLKVNFIKQQMPSYQMTLPSSPECEQIKQYLDALSADEEKISGSINKPEFQIIHEEINRLKLIWQQKWLDQSREEIARSLKSCKYSRVSNNQEALTKYLRSIHEDIHFLSDHLENGFEHEFYCKLLNEKSKILEQIKSLDEAGKSADQKSKLIFISPIPNNDDYIPDIRNNPTKVPASFFNTPGKKSVGKGLAYGFLITLCFCISGFMLYAILSTLYPNMDNDPLMGIFFISITIGYILGARIFSTYALPDITIRGVPGLPDIMMSSNKSGDGITLPFITRLLVGIYTLILIILIGIIFVCYFPDQTFPVIIIIVAPIFSVLAIFRTKVTTYLS